MQKKVEAYIAKHNMLRQNDRVIAAVSGGADSVCLLKLLVDLRGRLHLEIQAVHVHHGLRGREADRDAEFVRELSEKWKVPCLVVYRDAAAYGKEHGIGVEEAGRQLRYQVFDEAAARWGGTRIAVAHHRDDQAETILHNLFRGSGLKGLGGMAPVRDNVIRPLLCVGRQEIAGYLEEQNISFCQDSTNELTDYTRNKLRHKVLPAVCGEINPAAAVHIAAAGERIRQAEEYFEREAGRFWAEHGRREQEEESDKMRQGIPAAVVRMLPDILKGYVVMRMIEETGKPLKDISAVHVEQVLGLAEKGTGKSVRLPGGISVYREYEMIWMESASKHGPEGEIGCLNGIELAVRCFPASVFREKYREIPENKYTKWFDYDKIKGTLSVRTRKTGDYFILKDGSRKTIKSFMIDEKIPRQERDKILLLAQGQHILWVIGYRISEFYKITEETKQILQVRMDGGEEHGG